VVSGTVNITEPTLFTLSALTVEDIVCNAKLGSITPVVTGGTLPYTFDWSDSSTDSIATVIDGGSYVVTFTDADGCVLSDSAAVNDGIELQLNVTSTVDTNATGNGTATASPLNGIAPYQYTWNDGNAQQTATATGLTAGTYVVQVLDSNGCSASDTVVVDAFTGMDNADIAQQIRVYPNPGTGIFKIQLPTGSNLEQLAIIDPLGRTVWKKDLHTVDGTAINADISSEATGVYLLRLTSADRTWYGRLILSK
jgi:hypothetical protein